MTILKMNFDKESLKFYATDFSCDDQKILNTVIKMETQRTADFVDWSNFILTNVRKYAFRASTSSQIDPNHMSAGMVSMKWLFSNVEEKKIL